MPQNEKHKIYQKLDELENQIHYMRQVKNSKRYSRFMREKAKETLTKLLKEREQLLD